MKAPVRLYGASALALVIAVVVVCLVVASAAIAGDEKAPSASPMTGLPPGSHLGEAPSAVIYPPSTKALKFSHPRHAARGVGCLQCHPQASHSTRVSDRLLPSGRLCDRCHGSDHTNLNAVREGTEERGRCATCHVASQEVSNAVMRKVMGDAFLRFDHRVHARRNIGCAQCHGAIDRVQHSSPNHLPRMATCLRCHAQPDESRGDAKAGCATCHLVQAGGRMRTALPTGRLVPSRHVAGAEHGPDFAHRHGTVAANQSRLCASCHGEDECVRCHHGTVRPRDVHPNDYLSMHALEAQMNAQRCRSCHQQESFCKTCHVRAGVTQTGPSRQRRAQGRVHPPPEVFVSRPVTPSHHGWEARRNLNACVSCHLERDCVTCHSSRGRGGLGVNPHGAGFITRCATAFARNARPCLVCHQVGDPFLARCR